MVLNKTKIVLLSLVGVALVFFFVKHPKPERTHYQGPLEKSNASDLVEKITSCDSIEKLQLTVFLKKYDENIKPTMSFTNKHIRVENTVYRLREFIDDGENGDILTFQVFKEDQDDFPEVIETTPTEPGEIYKKLLNSKYEILFQEQGYLDEDETLFTFENGVISSIVGQKLECHFTK